MYVSVDFSFLDLPFLKASNSFIFHIALFTFFPVIVSYKVICLFHDISLNARPMHWTELSYTFWLLVSFFLQTRLQPPYFKITRPLFSSKVSEFHIFREAILKEMNFVREFVSQPWT